MKISIISFQKKKQKAKERKRVFKAFFHISFISILLLSVSFGAETPKRPFIWLDDEDYKPLIYRDERGKARGLFYDVMSEAFKRMNTPLQNRLYPWSRTQKLVESGKGDGMITLYTPRRQKIFQATAPIVVLHEYVFTSKNNPKLDEILNVRSISDLKKFIIVDTESSGWSKENLKGMKVIWVPTAKSALNMVASGRADVYLLSEYSGPYFIQQQIKKGGPLQKKLKQIVMGNYPLARMEYRLLIRKNSPYVGIIDHFNIVLEQMHKDGTYQQIIKHYCIDMKYHSIKIKKIKK